MPDLASEEYKHITFAPKTLLSVDSYEKDDDGSTRFVVNDHAPHDDKKAERMSRLIEAAPDMLETLYRVQNFLTCSSPALRHSHCATVVANAIAKATGGAK